MDEQQEDLELTEREAAKIKGGAPPKTPATPPGVPVPYPNVAAPKK
jgi:hypothetical protein